MRTAITRIIVWTFFTRFGAGQLPPTFEVASIRANRTEACRPTAEFPAGGQRFVASNISLAHLIVLAYKIAPVQLGPLEGIAYQRFDVQASTDRAVPRDEMLRMLQTLLAERFKLRLRREMREVPVYALVIAKGGPRIQLSKEQVSWSFTRADGNEQHRGRVNQITFANESMPDFASVLSSLLAVGRIVLDQTGLGGEYDFELDFTPPDLPGGATDSDAPSIFTAVQEQLGLKLEARRAVVPFLFIEHAENPSEN